MAQGRTEQGMVQWAIGEMEGSSSVKPGPYQPPLNRRKTGRSLQNVHPWGNTPGWSPQTLKEMRLCEIIHCRIVLGAQGESGDLCEISVCNPLLTVLLPQRLLRALLAPLHPQIHGGQQAQPKRAPIQAEV